VSIFENILGRSAGGFLSVYVKETLSVVDFEDGQFYAKYPVLWVLGRKTGAFCSLAR